MRKFKPLSYLI